MFNKFKITCEQAHEICNKSQYGESSFKEKLKLSFHILFCKICSLYVKQNATITKICNSKSQDVKSKTYNMSEKQKQILSDKMKQLDS